MKMGCKTCFKCKESKSTALFFKHNQTSDGFHSWCKSCCMEGNRISREKQNSTIEGRAVVFLRNSKKNSIKRGHEFDLNVSDIVSFWDKQMGLCAYTGRQMSLDAGNLDTVSIERIDSKIGYTKENTILVCQAINRMKSDFAYEDFFNLCRDVAEWLGDENLVLSAGAHK